MKIKILYSVLVFFPFSFATLKAQQDTVSILTWNIYMRPRFVFWNNQKERAKGIVNELNKESVDIIVFQEAFDAKAKRIITKGLKLRFPYEAGPGKKGVFKLTSGVWILSKYPIVNSDIEVYTACDASDCMAKKSVVFSEIQIRDKKIQLFGTHLQAISGESYAAIRESQMKQIAGLMKEHHTDMIPQLVAGDMNTPFADSLAYKTMLTLLSCSDSYPHGAIKYSSRSEENDINQKPVSNPKLIDFILLKENKTSAKITSREIKRYQTVMKTGKRDLSDHYAVKGLLTF